MCRRRRRRRWRVGDSFAKSEPGADFDATPGDGHLHAVAANGNAGTANGDACAANRGADPHANADANQDTVTDAHEDADASSANANGDTPALVLRLLAMALLG